jgi:hypothetical protein
MVVNLQIKNSLAITWHTTRSEEYKVKIVHSMGKCEFCGGCNVTGFGNWKWK